MKSIYGLHAGDGEIRYVGQTGAPLRTRLSQHKSRSRDPKSDVHRWIQEIGRDNVEIVLLEECADDVAQEREYDYIESLPDLLNGWQREMPNWMREKIAHSVAKHLAENGHPRSGVTLTDETRAKISAATMGRVPWNKRTA